MRTWWIWLLALVLLGPPSTASADEDGVRTDRPAGRVLPLPDDEEVFHFVIFGDRTGGVPEGIEVLEQAVADTNLLGPDLVMTVGDLIQGYTTRGPWLEQMREYRRVMGGLRMPWFPVAGNHDVYWRGEGRPPGHHEKAYEEHFGPLWYSFVHKNCAFVVLYSDEGDPERNQKGWGSPRTNQMSAAQLRWLDKTLEANRERDHVFVFLHHPRWRGDYYRGTNWDDAHRLFQEAGNVTACFAGHMHRTHYAGERDGVRYYTLAATGGRLPMEQPRTGWWHHMNLVTVRPSGITVAAIPVGQVLDPSAFTKEHLAEVDEARTGGLFVTGTPLRLTTDEIVLGRLAVTLDNPGRGRLHVTARIECGDWDWQAWPDHRHLVIEGRGEETCVFELRRLVAPDWSRFERPRLVVERAYESGMGLIALPPLSRTLDVQLERLPADAFEATPARSLDVDGQRGAVRIPAGWIALEPEQPLTLECWFQARGVAGRRGLVTKMEASEYGLFVSDGQPTFHVHLGGGYVRVAAPAGVLADGEWHHLAGVYDGAEVRLYVDGRLAERKAARGSRRINPLPLVVGGDVDRRGKPTSLVDGRLDEVRLSRVARYAGERAAGYARRHQPDADTLVLLHFDRRYGPFHPDAALALQGRHPVGEADRELAPEGAPLEK